MSINKSILLVCIGIFFIISSFVLGNIVKNKQSSISKIDASISHYVISTKTPERTSLMKKITHYGDEKIIIGITVLAMITMMFFGYWRIASCTALSLFIINIFTGFLKNFFDRIRPTEMLGSASGYSYPSGHQTGTVIVFFMISWFIYSSVKNKWLKTLGIIISVLLALSVGFSRIFLNVHWFSDVIGGIVISVGVGLICIGITSIITQKLNKI